VKINIACEIPLSVRADFTCSLYTEDVLLLRSVSQIQKSRSGEFNFLGLPQAKLTASASVIKETDTVQLSCENTEDLKMEMCYFNINGRESKSELSSSCQLSLTGPQISIWSEGQSSSVRITCDYTVEKSQVLIPSPHSDPVTITIQSKFFFNA
ncbi:hypothetical protein PO909_020241, partial [Leuciscus waleckii]